MWPLKSRNPLDRGGKPLEPRLIDKLLPLWVVAGMSIAVALLSLLLLAAVSDYRAYCKNAVCKEEVAAPSSPAPSAPAQPGP
jgi:hypothetical protein